MNVYDKLLDNNIIHPHHSFIKALTKRENHHCHIAYGLPDLFPLFISKMFLMNV